MPEERPTVRVIKALTSEQKEAGFVVRRTVFVGEQQVSPELEFDTFEQESIHFIGVDSIGKTCGAARWRKTRLGVKLERFAVLASHRRQGIGAALLNAILNDIHADPNARTERIYLNAQIDAVPFYDKFGFQPCGEEFVEADIVHQQMERLR